VVPTGFAGGPVAAHVAVSHFCPALATGLSWLCYFRALQLGPGVAGWLPSTSSAWCSPSRWRQCFLRERLTWHQWMGGMLIVAGSARHRMENRVHPEKHCLSPVILSVAKNPI